MRFGIVVTSVLALGACKRTGGVPPSADAGSPARSQVPAPALSSQAATSPRFSRPIAATHVEGGGVVVAGLVVPHSSIGVARLAPDGATRWATEILAGVKWSANAALYASAAGESAAIAWRGLRDGGVVTQLVSFSPSGTPRGSPWDVGAAACGTGEALAWIERARGGTRVRMRAWTAPSPDDVATLPADRDPSVVCGTHRVLALGEGDDDITAVTIDGPDAAAPPRVIVRDRDFSGDEEREHDEYTVGDALGIVRIGKAGAIAVRELVDQTVSPWRKVAHKLAEADDVVAVDADPHSVLIVFTRDQSSKCSGTAASSVHVLRLERGGEGETLLDVAPGECGRELGPFWTGALAGSFVVAWPERSPKGDSKTAPISGLAYRTIVRDALGDLRRVVRASDDLVDAGCDQDRCYAVALVRAPGTDDSLPEAVETISYP
jgi:hypothetical protein